MKFDYLVKHNGIYYKAGEEVPMGETTPKVTPKPIVEEKKVEPIAKPIIEETKVEEVDTNTNEKKYTKTDINRMSTKELRDLAKENGINGNDFVGSELKAILIDKLV